MQVKINYHYNSSNYFKDKNTNCKYIKNLSGYANVETFISVTSNNKFHGWMDS